MSIEFVLLSRLEIGKSYRRLLFQGSIRYVDRQLGKTAMENVKEVTDLGKLIDIEKHGRSYDPDIILSFQKDNKSYRFEPAFNSSEAYMEYKEDTEEDSMERTLERTSRYKDEILGNDWALRPENVVFTQGIDLTSWSEGFEIGLSTNA